MLQMILPLLLLFGIWLVVNIYRGIISNLPGNLFILENTSVPPPASWRFFCPHPALTLLRFWEAHMKIRLLLQWKERTSHKPKT